MIISIVDISDEILCIVSDLHSGFAFQKVPGQIKPAQVIIHHLDTMVLCESDFPRAAGEGHWTISIKHTDCRNRNKGSIAVQLVEVSPT